MRSRLVQIAALAVFSVLPFAAGAQTKGVADRLYIHDKTQRDSLKLAPEYYE